MDYRDRITADSESAKWKVIARDRNRRVEAIKEFRHMTGAGLKEAKDTVEEYADRLGRGEVFSGTANSVTLTRVRLGPEDELVITSDGPHGNTVQHIRTVGVYISNGCLPQFIADFVMKNYAGGE